jgi:hypothetical protein
VNAMESRFAQRAAELLETAASAAARGEAFSEMTVLVDQRGGLRLIANSDWPLDSLAMHHGARSAYRVARDSTGIRVVAQESGRTCVMESRDPGRVARLLLG